MPNTALRRTRVFWSNGAEAPYPAHLARPPPQPPRSQPACLYHGLARGLDRLQPILLNRYGGGHSWRKHGIRRDQVLARNVEIKALAPELWALVEQLTEEAVSEGLLLA